MPASPCHPHVWIFDEVRTELRLLTLKKGMLHIRSELSKHLLGSSKHPPELSEHSPELSKSHYFIHISPH